MSVVDARGLRCPLPVLRLARRARELPAGSELTLLATDPAAAPDVRAWARLRGHGVVSVVEEAVGDASRCWRIVVRLSG